MRIIRSVRGEVSACIIGAFALSVLPNVTVALSELPKNAALVYYQACLKNLELEYQTTDEGFSLRCRTLVDDFRELRRFRFRVRREEN